MRTFLPTTTFLQKTYLILGAVDSSLTQTVFATSSLTSALEDCVLTVHISDSTCAGHFDPAASLSVMFAKTDGLDLQSKADLDVNFPLFMRKYYTGLAIFYFKIYLKKTDN